MKDNMDFEEIVFGLKERMDAIAAEIEERRLKIFALSIEVEELKAELDGKMMVQHDG